MLPEIIVLHGWGKNKLFWNEFVNRFQSGRAAAFDLPGFDGKTTNVSDWDVPEYGAWLKNKIESSEYTNIVLLGHSFGGRIAGFVAGENPLWLKGLILYGAPCLYRPNIYIRLKIALAKLAKKIGFRKTGKSKELREAEENKMGEVFRRAVPFDQTDRLPKIKVPTLIVWGRNDTEVPLKIAHEMNNLITGSKLIVMDGVGHNAHLENPDLFYGVIKNFIENL